MQVGFACRKFTSEPIDRFDVTCRSPVPAQSPWAARRAGLWPSL